MPLRKADSLPADTVSTAPSRWALRPEQLRARLDPRQLTFETTAELPAEAGVIGQERAVRALDFGLHMMSHGYNIYAAGMAGTGKASLIRARLKEAAARQATPEDWCYVHNFQDPDRPCTLSLPAGRGRELLRDMERLIATLREEFPRVFQSKDYEDQRQALEDSFNKAQARLSAELEERAKASGFLLRATRVGIVVVPVHEGKALDPEQLEALEPQVKAEIRSREKDVDEAIRAFRQAMRAAQEESNQKLEELNHRVARYGSEHFFEGLREKYRDLPKLLDYLQAVQHDVQENFHFFLAVEESSAPGAEEPAGRFLIRYTVNLVVDNSATRGAPVVEEANPTHANLVGRIEKKARLGFLYTDFTLIKAGAILRANGGYLLLNALDVLRNPFAWDALKRVLKKGEVLVEDVAEVHGLVSTVGIRPEPIPMQLRVILVGNPWIYELLQSYDGDFRGLFKVKADFDTEYARSGTAPDEYARFIARLCREEGLLHLERGAVAAVLEQAARWAAHQRKLSLRFSDLADLIREASYWAGRDGSTLVARTHVQQAVAERIYRSNLLEERIRELMAEGTLRVDVAGRVTGQVNALSVHELGDFAFGRPARITARVFLGQEGVVNIEREAKLSGKTHSKGVLILSGYLGGRYARKGSLSLSATVAFEQSYGTVEGDSASAAELAVLLSAIADLPLRQDIAVTGSVDQRGELQAVGGVNEKIEGFYAACQALGPSSSQGVIIPLANVQHLMLKEEVVEAVAAGCFHVYAVDSMDAVMEILADQPAGEPQPDGSYPADTVNAAVLRRLREMEERLLALKRAER